MPNCTRVHLFCIRRLSTVCRLATSYEITFTQTVVWLRSLDVRIRVQFLDYTSACKRSYIGGGGPCVRLFHRDRTLCESSRERGSIQPREGFQAALYLPKQSLSAAVIPRHDTIYLGELARKPINDELQDYYSDWLRRVRAPSSLDYTARARR